MTPEERLSTRAWLARAILILLSAAISVVGIWLAILHFLGAATDASGRGLHRCRGPAGGARR